MAAEVYYYKQTGEEVRPLLRSQRFIDFDYSRDLLDQYIQSPICTVSPIELKDNFIKKVNSTTSLCVSNTGTGGLALPLWFGKKNKQSLIEESELLSLFQKKRSKKNILLTLMLFNCILDGNLPNYFSPEEAMEELFAPSIEGEEQTKIEVYLEIYRRETQENKDYKPYKSELKDIEGLLSWIEKNTKKSQEKIHNLLDLLEKSFLIEKIGDHYHIQIEDVVEKDFAPAKGKQLELANIYFDHQYIDALELIHTFDFPKSDDFKKIQQSGDTVVEKLDKLDNVVYTSLFTLQYAKVIPYNTIKFYYPLNDTKANTLSRLHDKFLLTETKELLHTYGPEIVRASLIAAGEDTNN